MFLSPPESYNGRVSTFIQHFVVPNLPAAESLISWTEALLSYHLEHPNPVCIVRGRRLGVLHEVQNSTVVESDNSPGIWVYSRSRDGAVPPNDVPEVITRGALPVLMAISRQQRAAWTYGQALNAGDKAALWHRGLKHCHIFPARPRGEQLSPRQLALRNIAPLNHFLFPSPKAFDMVVTGSAPERVDLGENAIVIEWVLQAIADHVQEYRAVFNRFVHAVGVVFSGRTPADLSIHIHRKRPNVAIEPPDSMLPKRQTSVLPAATTRLNRWTLNALHGYYVRTGLPLFPINVALAFKSLEGDVTYVGTFSLDIPALASAGAVALRQQHDRIVADVRIVREPGGPYWVTGGKSRVRLA